MHAKRRRQSIAGLGAVTDSALVQIAQAFRSDPGLLDDVSSRQSVQRATAAVLDPCIQRDRLPLHDGTEFVWSHASPQKMFQFFYNESPAYKAMIDEALRREPNSLRQPWHVVLYADEITPGNPLRPQTSRKLHCFYFAFREQRQSVLGHAEAWLPAAVLRSTVCKEGEGGFSCAMRVLLRRFFCGPEGMSTSGVVLVSGGVPQLFFVSQSWAIC